MRTAAELKQATAEEIAQDVLNRMASFSMNYQLDANVATVGWRESDVTVKDEIEELARRASEEKSPVKTKKQAEEVSVKTVLHPERMSLSMDPETKERYQAFLKDKQNPYVVTTAALELFMKQYRERKVRVTLEV